YATRNRYDRSPNHSPSGRSEKWTPIGRQGDREQAERQSRTATDRVEQARGHARGSELRRVPRALRRERACVSVSGENRLGAQEPFQQVREARDCRYARHRRRRERDARQRGRWVIQAERDTRGSGGNRRRGRTRGRQGPARRRERTVNTSTETACQVGGKKECLAAARRKKSESRE